MHHCVLIKIGNYKDIEHRIFQDNQRNAEGEAQIFMFSKALRAIGRAQTVIIKVRASDFNQIACVFFMN